MCRIKIKISYYIIICNIGKAMFLYVLIYANSMWMVYTLLETGTTHTCSCLLICILQKCLKMRTRKQLHYLKHKIMSLFTEVMIRPLISLYKYTTISFVGRRRSFDCHIGTKRQTQSRASRASVCVLSCLWHNR